MVKNIEYNVNEQGKIICDKKYILELTGAAKSGKSYYTSQNYEKALVLDFYWDNSLCGNVIKVCKDNVYGFVDNVVSTLVQLDQSEKYKYNTLVFDGFEKFYQKLYNEFSRIVKVPYWNSQDKEPIYTVMEMACFRWFSKLLDCGYNIIIIQPSGKDGLYQHIDYSMHLSYKRLLEAFENRIGGYIHFDDNGDRIINFDINKFRCKI